VSRRPTALAALAALLAPLALSCASAGKKPDEAPRAQAPQAAAEPAVPAGPDRSEVPPRGPPPALDVPAQQKFTLSNGLRVRLVEYRRLPIVALNLVLDAGAVHDPPDRPGLASFTAAMLTEGTKTRSATRISDELGAIGAGLSAGAGFDSASLSGSTLARHLDTLLGLFADVLRNPAFPESDFTRVKDQRLVTLVQQRDQPGALASKAFAGAWWGSHPYGHWLLGTEESLKALGRDELRRFHATWWRPARAELVVVGDVSADELRAKLEKALAGWTGAPPPPKVAPAQPPGKLQTLLIAKKDAPQSYLLLGMPGHARANEDYFAGDVAFQILGGGSASRLFRNLREEKGYTYGVYARGESRRLGGASFVAGSVRADVTGPALEEIFAELRRLREEPVSAEELENAKNAIVLSLPGDFSTAGGIASKIAEEVVHGLPDDYWDRFAARVAAVTAEDVRRFASTYLDPSRLTTVMVAEPAAVEPQLAALPLGKIEVRRAPPSPAAAGNPGAKPAAAPANPSHLPRKPARPSARTSEPAPPPAPPRAEAR
jgi:predicted Zn-dependent peptidase